MRRCYSERATSAYAKRFRQAEAEGPGQDRCGYEFGRQFDGLYGEQSSGGRKSERWERYSGETPGGAPVEATSATATGAPDATRPNPAIKVYQNYDFTPGETILFTDDFTATQDGEFPAEWELTKGQAVVNRQQGFQSSLY